MKIKVELVFNLFYDMTMTDSVIIDLLVLSLLLAVNFRLFFMTRGQRDVVVLLAPVALCICLLGLFAWDFSLPKALILLLAFLVFAENVHSLWRFCSKLYVDYFSPVLWLVSIVNILLILGLGALVFLLRPLPVDPDLNVVQRTVALSGSVRSGLTPRKGFFDTADVMLVQYKPAQETSPWSERGARLENPTGFQESLPSLPLVLWVTDGRSSVNRVEPVAATLASLGYEVVVADFNRQLIESAVLRVQGLFFPHKITERQATLQQESTFQYSALMDYFGGERGLAGRKVVLLADGYTGAGAKAASALHDFVAGFFIINGEDSLGNHTTIPDWTDGFGPVVETAPWIPVVLKQKSLRESRDETRFYSIAAAYKSHQFFSTVFATKEEL